MLLHLTILKTKLNLLDNTVIGSVSGSGDFNSEHGDRIKYIGKLLSDKSWNLYMYNFDNPSGQNVSFELLINDNDLSNLPTEFTVILKTGKQVRIFTLKSGADVTDMFESPIEYFITKDDDHINHTVTLEGFALNGNKIKVNIKVNRKKRYIVQNIYIERKYNRQ